MYVCMYVWYQVTEQVAKASRTLLAKSDFVPIDNPVINVAKDAYPDPAATSFETLLTVAFICFWWLFCDWIMALHTMLVCMYVCMYV